MADMNERDAKLVQYLSEAYGKERELESALEAHIGMTTKAAYKKRLKQHLKETKSHAKQVQRRIKQLGGGTQTAQTVVAKVTAAAKGPLHAVRGSGEPEKMLKNAKTEYFNEHEEIATYLAIETLATKVGDRETAQLAAAIRREEERMAKFLEGQIKSLTATVAGEEIPRSQRGSSPKKRSTKRAKKPATSKPAKAAPKGPKKAAKKATRKSAKTAKKAVRKAAPKKAKKAARPKTAKKGASRKGVKKA